MAHWRKGTARKPYGARVIGTHVPALMRPAFEKFGFAAAALLTDWAAIVGADVAAYTAPDRLKWPRQKNALETGAEDGGPGRAAVLVLRVDGPRALEIQHQTPQLIERINSYFGYRAVGEVRLIQAPVTMTEKPGAPAHVAKKRALHRSRGAHPNWASDKELQGIAEPRLRAALERMAAGAQARAIV